MSLVKSDSHNRGGISAEVFARQEGSVHYGNFAIHDGNLKSSYLSLLLQFQFASVFY